MLKAAVGVVSKSIHDTRQGTTASTDFSPFLLSCSYIFTLKGSSVRNVMAHKAGISFLKLRAWVNDKKEKKNYLIKFMNCFNLLVNSSKA